MPNLPISSSFATTRAILIPYQPRPHADLLAPGILHNTTNHVSTHPHNIHPKDASPYLFHTDPILLSAGLDSFKVSWRALKASGLDSRLYCCRLANMGDCEFVRRGLPLTRMSRASRQVNVHFSSSRPERCFRHRRRRRCCWWVHPCLPCLPREKYNYVSKRATLELAKGRRS